jgi:hypothetical protein
MSDFPAGADPIAEPLEGRCLCGAVIEDAKSKGFDFPDG